MGGYATRYANDFDFLTIRGAGHMVPEYKPEAAFVMMLGEKMFGLVVKCKESPWAFHLAFGYLDRDHGLWSRRSS